MVGQQGGRVCRDSAERRLRIPPFFPWARSIATTPQAGVKGRRHDRALQLHDTRDDTRPWVAGISARYARPFPNGTSVPSLSPIEERTPDSTSPTIQQARSLRAWAHRTVPLKDLSLALVEPERPIHHKRPPLEVHLGRQMGKNKGGETAAIRQIPGRQIWGLG